MGKRATSGRHTPASSRRCTDEFKRDAVALLRSSGRPVAVAALDDQTARANPALRGAKGVGPGTAAILDQRGW